LEPASTRRTAGVTDNEWRLSAYVLDVIQNGTVFSQTDTAGRIAFKPPLLIWLCTLCTLPSGEIS
jgi:hypothetical protein